LDIARILLDACADVGARGYLPWQTAIYYGYRDMVELFLERGAD
jgi:hypothetical protein